MNIKNYDLKKNYFLITIKNRFYMIKWRLIVLIFILAMIGFIMLYSAAHGSFEPWAKRQIIRFIIGNCLMLLIALINIRILFHFSYITYILSLILLISVEIKGHIGMGAQRWIDFEIFQIQPSELIKISLVLALARYFHTLKFKDTKGIIILIPPLIMIIIPAILVLRQPDLGTAILIICGGGTIFWLSGIPIWKFSFIFISVLLIFPIGWQFLHNYQKNRILTFLNPDNDPLGSGYHITQSKIALGSGGLYGKGFMLGSQSYLNFLPEKQTDFIFTMLGEEFGFIGSIIFIFLNTCIIIYGYIISFQCYNQFGRLVALGLISTFFLYIFINIAMVIGLIPVVGVPLPLVSYGGTVMISILVSFGLLLSISIDKKIHTLS